MCLWCKNSWDSLWIENEFISVLLQPNNSAMEPPTSCKMLKSFMGGCPMFECLSMPWPSFSSHFTSCLRRMCYTSGVRNNFKELKKTCSVHIDHDFFCEGFASHSLLTSTNNFISTLLAQGLRESSILYIIWLDHFEELKRIIIRLSATTLH